jgi:hypothetical protein
LGLARLGTERARSSFTTFYYFEPARSEPFEREEYRSFEDAIVSEYLPQTPVEQELCIASPRSSGDFAGQLRIETGLLRMQTEILHAFRSSRQSAATLSSAARRTECSST